MLLMQSILFKIFFLIGHQDKWVEEIRNLDIHNMFF